MRWDLVKASPQRVTLARRLVEVCSGAGWNRASLRMASRTSLGDPDAWRTHFPAGPREAIWFISEVSDASMCAAFQAQAAQEMGEVILERLRQNADLKPFVRRVMAYDLFHPIQALARMQRTAHDMFKCLGPVSRSSGVLRATLLNLAYTMIVFAWLLDSAGEGPLTRGATSRLLKLIGLETR